MPGSFLGGLAGIQLGQQLLPEFGNRDLAVRRAPGAIRIKDHHVLRAVASIPVGNADQDDGFRLDQGNDLAIDPAGAEVVIVRAENPRDSRRRLGPREPERLRAIPRPWPSDRPSTRSRRCPAVRAGFPPKESPCPGRSLPDSERHFREAGRGAAPPEPKRLGRRKASKGREVHSSWGTFRAARDGSQAALAGRHFWIFARSTCNE